MFVLYVCIVGTPTEEQPTVGLNGYVMPLK